MRCALYIFFLGLFLSTWARSKGDVEFFEKKIRPVLAEKCFSCHSAGSDKLKGELQLDHIEHLLTGGETGPVVVPGDAEKSLLIESIRYENVDLEMPPKEKLSDAIVADFETWINEGAVWPEEPIPERGGDEAGFDLEKRRAEHWSWRPVERPEIPEVARADWPREGIDSFVLERLERAGLRPALEAEKAVWLRRVYFDLIGLPPTPEEVSEFEKGQSEEGYEAVVDRLLDSPHFGERWARHWMDLVRYAETYGHEFDYPIPYASEYRDYLIRAFNEDVPYDDFVREHIAGDLLENPRRHPVEGFNESIIGTGFWFLHEATHAPTDVLANESDIMDNQLDVFGKSFLGLTVSCARCHDHKFDAISTADYYALTAYLHSSARQSYPLDPHQQRQQALDQLIALKDEADSQLPPNRFSEAESSEFIFEDFSEGVIPEDWSVTGLAFSGSGVAPGVRFEVKDPLTYPGTIDSGVYGREQVGSLRTPTFTLEADKIHLRVKGTGAAVSLIIDNYQMLRYNQLLFRGALIKNIDSADEFQWLTLDKNLDKYVGHKVYLEFADEGKGEIILDEIRIGGPVPEDSNPARNPIDLDRDVLALVKQGQEIAGKLPPTRFALAMAEGTPERAAVYVRGSHRSLGEEVPRRFLTALGGVEGDRLILANEVARADNPLTSRVVVNRIWHHLFGRGVVASVDDFGPMGQQPTHPEMLDWLADEMVEQDWSMKAMIRQLVLSSTYRQSSTAEPGISLEMVAEVDPENQLLHRMPVKRLSGEAIRDSILAVSGELDPARYGPSIPTHRTDFMTGRGGRDSGPLDGAGRRSIYGAVYRNFLSPFMLTFDVPSPFGPKGRRSVSNVPAQALVLMNDPFVAEQSEKWGARVAEMPGEPLEKVSLMFQEGLSREPSAMELERVASFFESETAAGMEAPEAWAHVGHIVFNMKEFIFIH
ncbi:MAG: PSD1 and planctomycete cytochrome C domain-containing protein [Verrucomicrobiota bacterium]